MIAATSCGAGGAAAAAVSRDYWLSVESAEPQRQQRATGSPFKTLLSLFAIGSSVQITSQRFFTVARE